MTKKKNLFTENNLLTFIPFALTTFFIFVGYQILVSTTPEARVAPNIQQAQAEIISDDDFQVVKPSVPIPAILNLYLAQIPDKQIQLDQTISGAQKMQANGIYFYLPVTLKDDLTIEPTNVHQTNIENITRWVKKAASQAHQNNLHVVFALTYNATTTIKDPSTFIQHLQEFLPRWAGLANEVSIAFFNPGITIGHPLYSELTNQQISELLLSTQSITRSKYSGRIGVGYCCTTDPQVNPKGYTFVVAIPTPEYDTDTLATQISLFTQTYDIQHALLFDRDNKTVSSFSGL